MEDLRRFDGELLGGLIISPRCNMISPRRSLKTEFRAHFGFMALIIVCGACIVYLMQVLRSVLRPFLWALFLVMGLTPAVSVVERAIFGVVLCVINILHCICGSCRWCCPCQRHRRMLLPPTVGSCPGAEKLSRRAGNRWFGAQASALEPPGCGTDISERDLLEKDHDHEEKEKAWGPCARFVVHTLAIAIVVASVVCIIGGFILLIFHSAISLQGHWDVYKKGARNIGTSVQLLVARVTGSMPKEMMDELTQNAVLHSEGFVSALVAEVLSNAWRFVLEFLMMALYIAFWLSHPMPIASKMQTLFKRYILLKGLACSGYGVCVGVLLRVLGVDLAEVFGLAAFLLSFVPEVGAIVAILLPMPVILFDSRLESPAFTLFVATMAQLALKFVFANVVEVKLVESDRLMKMHPVIILLAVTFFGFIWGPTGMLLSVPLVSYAKAVLLSQQVPSCYRDPLLIILEGDRSAPAKYAKRDQKRRTSVPTNEVINPQADVGSEVRRRSTSADTANTLGAGASSAIAADDVATAVSGAAPGSFVTSSIEKPADSMPAEWPISSPQAEVIGAAVLGRHDLGDKAIASIELDELRSDGSAGCPISDLGELEGLERHYEDNPSR